MKNQKDKKLKIVVGMSGGVDSSVAAFLLKKEGFEVVGVSLKFGVWESEKNLLKENVCCSSGAFLIAKNICNHLGMPFKIIDVRGKFLDKVVKYWKKEIKNYNTPNPCIVCNHAVKIQALVDFAKEIKADLVATGHYAQVCFNKKTMEYELRGAKDKTKDQLYFLSALDQKQLKMLKLPLAKYTKEEVYKIAKKAEFKVFQKTKQSQDFCFVANKSYGSLIEETFGNKTGEIVDTNGKKIGTHNGLYFYTVGQRRGINLSGGPFYVMKKDIEQNKLVVTKDKKDLFLTEFLVDKVKWINQVQKKDTQNILVQIRYGDKKSKADIEIKKDGKVKVMLKSPKMSITPGQFAVFYKGARCLGGGSIIG